VVPGSRTEPDHRRRRARSRSIRRSWSRSRLRQRTVRCSRRPQRVDRELSARRRRRVYVATRAGSSRATTSPGSATGELPQTLRFWAGDDIDATLVADEQGFIYAAVEYERKNERAREARPTPEAWTRTSPTIRGVGVRYRPARPAATATAGIWATPALYGEYLYVTTHPGDLIVVDRRDGRSSSERIGYHEWSSPVIVDETLVVALCDKGGCAATPGRPGRPDPAVGGPGPQRRLHRVDPGGLGGPDLRGVARRVGVRLPLIPSLRW
jgi:hypothetical protein